MTKKTIYLTDEGLVAVSSINTTQVGPCIYCGHVGNKVKQVGVGKRNGEVVQLYGVACAVCHHVSPPDTDLQVAIAKHNEPEERFRYYRKPRRDIELLMAKEMCCGILPANVEKVEEDG